MESECVARVAQAVKSGRSIVIAVLLSLCITSASSQTFRWELLPGLYRSESHFHFVVPHGERIVMGAQQGAFRLNGDGATWLKLGNFPSYVSQSPYPDSSLSPPVTITSGTSGRLYMVSRQEHWRPSDGELFAVHRSTDNGVSWQYLFSDFGVDLALGEGDTVYRLRTQYDYHPQSRLLRSTDGGLTWFIVAKSYENDAYFPGMSIQSGNVFVYHWYADGTPHRGVTEVRRSTDGGMTWKRLGLGSQVFFTPPNRFLLIRDSVEFSGDDGRTWGSVLKGEDAFVKAIANDHGVILLSTSDSRHFRSLDGGETWIQLTQGPAEDAVTADSFAGPDVLIGRSGSGHFYRSVDFGSAWEAVRTSAGELISGTLEKCSKELIVVARNDPDGVTLFDSYDLGGSWMVREFPHVPTEVICLAWHSSSRVLAGLTSGLFTQDDTTGWRQIYSGGPVLGVSHRDSGFTYIASGYSGWPPFLYNGKLVRMDALLDRTQVMAGSGIKYAYDTGEYAAVVCLTEGRVIAANYEVSLWNDSLTNKLHSDQFSGISSFVEGPMRSLFAGHHPLRGGSPQGIYRSTDGGRTWGTCNSGLMDLDVRAFAVNSDGEIFAGTSSGLFRSANGGELWEPAGLDGKNVQALAIDSWGRVFAGTTGWPHVSLDNGKTWTQLHEGLGSPDITALAVGGDGTVYCGSWGEGVYRLSEIPAPGSALVSPARGAMRQPLSLPLIWRTAPWGLTYDIQLSRSNDFTTGIVVDRQGLTETMTTVENLDSATTYYWRIRVRGTAGPLAWSLPQSFKTVMSLPSRVSLLSPAEGEVTGKDTLRLTWQRAGPEVLNYRMEIATDSLFTVTWKDSIVSDSTCLLSNLQQGKQHWWRVRAQNEEGWGPVSERRRFSVTLTDIEGAGGVPTEYMLFQNYPNPFNPSTTIRFGLPHRSHVTLTVFNTLGQQVAQLVNAEFESGYHDAVFEPTHLASGVYLYRLQSGAFVDVKKLTVVK